MAVGLALDSILPAMLAQDVKRPLREFFEDECYAVEQKLDGHRILLHINAKGAKPLHALNRNAQVSQHNARLQQPFWLANALPFKGVHAVLDGELIGDTLYVFDCPYLDGHVHRNMEFQERRKALEAIFGTGNFNGRLQLVPSVSHPEDKLKLFKRCVDERAEGIVIKDRDSKYIAGRTSAMQKLKFTHSAEFFISELGRDGKNNAVLSVYRDGQPIEVGKCSLIGKEEVALGDVVEVKYLYLSDDERIVQPRMKFKRTDKTAEDCTFDQLKTTNKKAVISL